MDVLFAVVLPALASLVLAAIIYGIGLFTSWLSTKIKNDKMNLILSLVDAATADAVNTVGSTFVQALKEKAADGKLTKEEMKEAFEMAKDIVVSVVGPKIKAIAKQIGIEFEALIRSKIETWVAEFKERWAK